MTRTRATLLRWIGVLALSAFPMFIGAPTAHAQISVVVSASSSRQASRSDVADMFVGARTTWSDGTQVQIVDQPDTEWGKVFYERFLNQSIAQVRTQWTRLVLSGQALAPKKVASPDAVKEALRANPAGIGYIPTSALDGTVKELVRIGG